MVSSLAGCEEGIMLAILAVTLAKKNLDLVEDVRGSFKVSNDSSKSFEGDIRLELCQTTNDAVVDAKRAALTVGGDSKRDLPFDELYGEQDGSHYLMLTIRDNEEEVIVKKRSDSFQIV
jgi:hypothetical protein